MHAGQVDTLHAVTAMDRVVKLTCTHDCPDACAMLVTIRDGRAVDVAPNPAHPVTGRHLCAKVDRYLERVYSPDRVLHPLRRTGAKGSATFERVSWDAAIDEIGRRWEAILAAEGPAAILPYSYLGSMYVPPAESPITQPALAQHYPLRLLTLKRHHSINSSHGGLPVLRRAEPEPRLEIHPDDAVARGIADGEPVRAWNDRGTVVYRAELTDRVMRGTVAAPFGHWIRDGASVNTLTSDRLGDIGNGPTFCDILVEVARAELPT